MLLIEEGGLREGLRLFAGQPTLGSFDAVLAATAKAAGAPVVSADAVFASVPGLVHVTPDEKGIRDLLAPDGTTRD